MFNYVKRHKFLILLILFVVIIVLYLLLNSNNNVAASNDIVIENKDNTATKTEENKQVVLDDTVTVEIKGAVNLPGVYTLKNGSRVNDVVISAGGFLDNASTDYINLSKKLVDEMVIKVYSIDEIEKSNRVEVITKYVEKECNCPSVQNDACIDNVIIQDNSISSTDSNNNEITSSGLVNINSATKEQLITVPGIGETKAVKIIEYRENNGKFNTAQDIMNVSGIGTSMYEKIKDYIEV